jgi:hypothetical protein
MVLNATFNNIAVLWVEETGVLGGKTTDLSKIVADIRTRNIERKDI